jgi:hypothetical protein
VTLVCQTDNQIERLERLCRHGVPETDAVKELAAIARRRLAAYPTTAAQDEALLRQGGYALRNPHSVCRFPVD